MRTAKMSAMHGSKRSRRGFDIRCLAFVGESPVSGAGIAPLFRFYGSGIKCSKSAELELTETLELGTGAGGSSTLTSE